MTIVFLGVGEAFDENLPNNSQLVMSGKTNLLLDCGWTVPTQIWKYSKDKSLDKDLIDAIYISHQHGDHFCGLPALLLRMWEEGRKKDLTIICQKNFKEKFREFMDFVYLGFMDKFNYKINLVEAVDGGEVKFNDLNLSFEETVHSGKNLAIKINDGKNNFCYSGDGSPKEGSGFYKNVDLAILETYLYDNEKIGHSTIVGAIKFAEENNIKCLALTHINREFRKNELPGLKNKIKGDKVKIIIPEPLEEYYF
jgi:ribonuclease Z